MLSQQSAILTCIATQALSSGWQTRVSGLQSLITQLTTLNQSTENYRVRSTMIDQIEDSISTLTVSPTETGVMNFEMSHPEFPIVAWTQQTAAIDAQSAYFLHIKDILERKEAELPAESSESVIGNLISSLLGEMAEEFLQWGIKKILSWLFGVGSGLNGVLAFLCVVGLLELKELWDKYVLGQALCQWLKDENDAIRNLSIEGEEEGTDNAKAWEYYRLREQILTRHNDQIHNLLTEIVALENQTKESIGQPGGPNEELIAAIRELGTTGYEIEAEDFRIRKLGRTLTAGSW